MAGSVNKCIILGFVGKNPEIKSFPSGDRIASFSIATSEGWNDKSTGEKREVTQWHNIVVKNDNIVRVVENYIHKGSKVYVEGQLQHRKYPDQNGMDRYVTEVVIGRFNGQLTLLDGRGEGGQSQVQNNNDDSDEIPF